MQGYYYEGTELLHSRIGQVMAYLGYEHCHAGQAAGEIILRDNNGTSWWLRCCWHDGDNLWRELVIPLQRNQNEQLKNTLLQWYYEAHHQSFGPWGTLIGVRPLKKFHKLLDSGKNLVEAALVLQRDYNVSIEKTAVLAEIAMIQRPLLLMPQDRGSKWRAVSVYIGIPYCASHCLYCSFPSRLIGGESSSDLQAFVTALVEDIQGVGALIENQKLTVDSIYVGGGTPTCLPIHLLDRLLAEIRRAFGAGHEFTMEAGRPDTAEPEKLQLLRTAGVTRVSVNPQTMQQSLLDCLGRRHLVSDIYRMYNQCRELGFSCINMDFIAGLPRQTVEDMKKNMEIVCQLGPENVTIHTLTLKKSAPLFHHALRAELPSENSVAQMLQICRKQLAMGTYKPYYLYRQKYMTGNFENTGYALAGQASRYNIQMMEERQTILGIGPGAATKFVTMPSLAPEKLYMPKKIDQYIQQVSLYNEKRTQLSEDVYK